MKKSIREREILNKLKLNEGFVTTEELCRELFSSESSIRRDLASLEAKGLVKRIYGGCELVLNHSGAIDFSNRITENAEAKRSMAKKAAQLIKDRDVVFLDESSSAYYLAEEIKQNSSLTVVTNNLEILNLLACSRMKVISCAGALFDGNRTCLIGSEAERTFRNIYADIVFFSTKSVSEDGIISDTVGEEVAVKRSMLENARTKVFICDKSKFGTRSAYKQCELRDVDIIVSDGEEIKNFKGAKRVIC